MRMSEKSSDLEQREKVTHILLQATSLSCLKEDMKAPSDFHRKVMERVELESCRKVLPRD